MPGIKTSSPTDLVSLLVPLCEALEYLHERGKVHGHLRPSNVFVTRTGSGLAPKLLDTGLSLLRPGRSIVTPSSLVLVEPEYLGVITRPLHVEGVPAPGGEK